MSGFNKNVSVDHLVTRKLYVYKQLTYSYISAVNEVYTTKMSLNVASPIVSLSC